MSEVIKKISKLTNHKNARTISTILLIVVCFFSFNLGDLLGNLFNSITSIFSNETEVKTMEFTSDGYAEELDGSFKVIKHVDWTSNSTVQMTYTVKSIAEKDSVKKDIILVFDISASMSTDSKLSYAKNNIKELVTEVLSEDGNKFALITFSDSATILSGLTDDEEALKTMVDNIEVSGDTNYYQAFSKVDEVLSTYTETTGREVEVLFITDGVPNVDNPNQNILFEEIKAKYPYITVHGIQYEMGEEVVVEIKRVSDYQYATKMEFLKNYLIIAAFSPEPYEVFKVADYIDNDYFTVESVNDINATTGNVSLTTENGQQVVTWTAPDGTFSTGSDQKLVVNLKLKDEYVSKEGLYPTSTREVLNLKLPGNDLVEFDTTDVTKLKAPYKIKYDANAPSSCNVSLDLVDEAYPFEIAKLSSETVSCDGYYFEGWQIVEDVTWVNAEYFIMPTSDITVRGVWTKIGIVKSMQGEVYEQFSLYKAIAKQSLGTDSSLSFSKFSSETNGRGIYTIADTASDEYPIHYFRGNIDNNHVIFAGFCWEILRTTDTGGVKLIYDGTPVNGTCPNTGKSAQLSTQVQFKNKSYSIANVGYMYNKVYDIINDDLAEKSEHLFTYMNMTNVINFYFGTSVTYDSSTNKYTLVNPTQYTWEGSYQNLDGYYICWSSHSYQCTDVNYVVKPTSATTAYLLKLVGGQTIEDFKMTIGTGYTESSGTYALTNTTTIRLVDWPEIYTDYVGQYMCSDTTSTSCSEIHYIYGTTDLLYYYNSSAIVYTFGNSFTYSNGKYNLTDTVSFWEPKKYHENIVGHKFTCLTEGDSCSEVKYINYVYHNSDGAFTGVYYIPLTGGIGPLEAVEEMLHASDVNKIDSTIKDYIDTWYESNLINYTDYIENTVFCNDRIVDVYGAWDPSNDSVKDMMTYKRMSGLACQNQLDQFTLSVANGGTDGYGNNALTYPIALPRYSELVYAGTVFARSESSTDSWLYTGNDYWTMSPGYTNNMATYMLIVKADGAVDYSFYLTDKTNYTAGVRPSISLIPGIEYTQGDGTESNPFVILTS